MYSLTSSNMPSRFSSRYSADEMSRTSASPDASAREAISASVLRSLSSMRHLPQDGVKGKEGAWEGTRSRRRRPLGGV